MTKGKLLQIAEAGSCYRPDARRIKPLNGWNIVKVTEGFQGNFQDERQF